ncbi:type I restriction enzyme S subunit [Bisgaardia hudsonensis]|uniref:Type I restriction enzyme S subunit n=1 Tax=Bisgaardia hudsonensis TaxID=109472 RepID=A0A4R2MXZ6_9PAST|nr:restriction endonuclease subunit S [Bisgaardia hudsonensis]TCP12706.1 type I restriction enzyme S subunit [Bisgaardia hudsonensis]
MRWKKLEEIFELRNGYTPSKSKSEFWENGNIPWFKMEDIRKNGNILNNSLQKVSNKAIKNGNLFEENSIIISTSATIGEHALITVPYLANQRFTNLRVKEEFKNKIDIKFIYYYCYLLDEWCKNNTTKSNFSSVDMKGFRAFTIPLPPLSVQEYIVSILDKFDTLVNDLNTGLPKEIEQRQKQYEYYREKLLNFSK